MDERSQIYDWIALYIFESRKNCFHKTTRSKLLQSNKEISMYLRDWNCSNCWNKTGANLSLIFAIFPGCIGLRQKKINLFKLNKITSNKARFVFFLNFSKRNQLINQTMKEDLDLLKRLQSSSNRICFCVTWKPASKIITHCSTKCSQNLH